MSAYSQGQAPLPPPPSGFRGGNRVSQHVVGGANANVGYSAGANLQNARQGYASGNAGSYFRNQATQKPEFNYKPPANAPTATQAVGNQIRANSSGQVANPTSTPGMGYGRLNSPVRQHTIAAQDGAEWGSYNMAPMHPTPPTPPPPTGGTGGSGGAGGAGVGNNSGTAIGSGGQVTIPPGYATPLMGTESVDNAMRNQTLRQEWAGKVQAGAIIPSLDGTAYKVVSLVAKDVNGNKTFVPMVYTKGDNKKLVIHPAWQNFNGFSDYTEATQTAPVGAAPTATAPVQTAPAGPAPAPAPTVSGAQSVRQKYGAVAPGTRVYGSDGMQRIVQKRAVNPRTGTQVPWVNKPGGGLMIHPDWQGV